MEVKLCKSNGLNLFFIKKKKDKKPNDYKTLMFSFQFCMGSCTFIHYKLKLF